MKVGRTRLTPRMNINNMFYEEGGRKKIIQSYETALINYPPHKMGIPLYHLIFDSRNGFSRYLYILSVNVKYSFGRVINNFYYITRNEMLKLSISKFAWKCARSVLYVTRDQVLCIQKNKSLWTAKNVFG